MGLISPGGENLLDFLELRQVLSTYDGDPQGPALVASGNASPYASCSGPLGIPLPSMAGPRSRVEWVPEPEDSSTVLTWILGYFWSLPRGVSPRLEWGHARALSSRSVAAVFHLPSG